MVYEFECPKDGYFEIICSYKDHKNPYNCPTCGSPSDQIFTTVSMQPDDHWHGKYYENLNRSFTSKSQRDAYLKSKNLAFMDEGYREDVKRNAEHLEKKRDQEVERYVADSLKDVAF